LASILIIEDEQLLGQTFQSSLSDEGHVVHWVSSAEAAQAWLTNRHVDLALIDIRLPGIDGVQFLRELLHTHPDTIAIMMTAQGDVETAVHAMKLGAVDFLIKPVDLDAVALIARRNLRQRRLAQTAKYEQRSRSNQFGLHQIIGECPQIEKARALVRRMCHLGVSASEHPPSILITGETGTGKDLLASAFHYEGPRRDGPFVQINCAALPESLAESELFGHTKGAFTSAGTNKRGLFEVADQGTLFLDEIGALPLALQAKILTAISTGRIRPVGSVDETTVNVQLVAAMNQDPLRLVQEGKFREDLYHRLRVLHAHLPPLRERGDDLHLLAEHFIAAHCRKFTLGRKRLSPQAREALCAYHWPGNVRELCHRLESAVLLGGEVLEADLLPGPSRGAVLAEAEGEAAMISADFSRGPVPLESVERELIVRAMVAAHNNVSGAAKLLSISRDTLRYRLEKYGLQTKRNGDAS
jgi:DNA-binding NtrC family response regulator